MSTYFRTFRQTDNVYHDVEIDGSKSVKQHSYRMHREKQQYLRKDSQYLLDNDFIEPSHQSDWRSCTLVPKPNGTLRRSLLIFLLFLLRMCTDYRKVNFVTKTRTLSIP